MKVTLTGSDAAAVNAAVGFSRNPNENPEDNPGASEGDEYDALELPNGGYLVLLGARDGVVVGVEVSGDDDESDSDDADETPVTA